MKRASFFRLLSFYPPFLGAGIRVTRVNEDVTEIDVEMKLRFWNQNYVGTQFGGSLYSMTDPFYMLILLENLGKNYIVWDKSAKIRFKKPGKGTMRAYFKVSQERLDEIRVAADLEAKVQPQFEVQILDEMGDVVAEVEKVLSVRRKNHSL
jgi:hypothetical protein